MLTNEEKDRIRLEEQYRAEIRASLGGPQKKESLFRDHLAVPVVLLLITALISGLVVPMILGRIEDERRGFELQSRLIEQIVGDDAAAQVSLVLYHSQTADYWIRLLDIERDKRLLALSNADPEERPARRAELQQDLARERNLWTEAQAGDRAATSKYLVEHRGNTEWVRLHYGDNPALDAYVKATRSVLADVAHHSYLYQGLIATAYRQAASALQTCPDAMACRQVAVNGRREIEQLRVRQPPNLSNWNKALRELIGYISTTKPRV